MTLKGLNQHFQTQMRLQMPIEEVFEFFSNVENLQRITPKSLHFRFLTPLPIEMRVGAKIDYVVSLFGIPMVWRTHITRWEPPTCFADDQDKGPYAQWTHTHRFRSEGEDTVIEDEIIYRLPLGYLGLIALPIVRYQVETIFRHREAAIKEALLSRSDSPD